MGLKRKRSLMAQMLMGQGALIAVNGAILVITAFAIAPSIFSGHLTQAGVVSKSARTHITEAYISSFQLSLLSAALISIIVSGLLAWYFMLRIVRPIYGVTTFAQSLASGEVDAKVPLESPIPELDQLTQVLVNLSLDLTKSREELARMLSDLAHELRTPIATVLAIVDGIEDELVVSDAHTWKTVRDQLERVNRLSRDVREVTQNSEKILTQLTSTCDPETIASTTYTAWSPKMKSKGVDFVLEIEPELPQIIVDPQRVGQVLSNLLENSLRHTPAGGSVKLRLLKSGDFVNFVVKDTGEGIDSDQLPFIFNRLYRGDPSRHSGDIGSGLGLTIAQKIAQSHGGSLIALSQGRDFGATFTLSLPITT